MQTLSQGNFIIHQTEKVVNIYMKNFIKIIEILQIFLFFRLKYTKISAIIDSADKFIDLHKSF